MTDTATVILSPVVRRQVISDLKSQEQAAREAGGLDAVAGFYAALRLALRAHMTVHILAPTEVTRTIEREKSGRRRWQEEQG